MPALSFEEYCSEIVTQTRLLADCIAGADLTTAVPSCPGWNVGQLVRHLGGGQRWAAETVRRRATKRVPDQHFRDLSAYRDEDPAVVGPWLAESAAGLADALALAGPDAPADTAPVPEGTAGFFARRFTHETAIHRADAMLALNADFCLDPAVAVDGIDEWMELGCLPMHFTIHPRMRELLGPGRTLHLHATDTAPELNAEWVVDLTGDALAWRRAHEKSAVAVRGPVVDVLLIVYRRRQARIDGVQIFGDEQLLDFWLERVGFE
jgi:uncharacterized protein (TIGR03083 family)